VSLRCSYMIVVLMEYSQSSYGSQLAHNRSLCLRCHVVSQSNYVLLMTISPH
jgi:hypothetical protein